MRSRMGRHGNTMTGLLRAVVLLDRPTVRVLAGRIADEEIVAGVEGRVPRRAKVDLPVGYAAEHEKLKAVAQELAAAAQGTDDNLLGERFAALSRTCVACHSAYVHGRPADGAPRE